MIRHTARTLSLIILGDDIWATGLAQDLAWLERGILGAFGGKVKGTLALARRRDQELEQDRAPHRAWLRMGRRPEPRRAVDPLLWAAFRGQGA